MKRYALLAAVAAAVLGILAVQGPADAARGVVGAYVEARSCDVFTGPCFANGEVGITGNEAILSWSIESGTWDGVVLDGLNVIAAVAASNTLGNPYQSPLPAKSVVIVDAKADADQAKALVSLAKRLGGPLVCDVVDVKSAPITANVGACDKNGCAHIKAEGLVEVSTRCLKDGDHKCSGNEGVYYTPLTTVDEATPAFTTVSAYSGDGLGVTWTNIDRRSAFIGDFAV